MNIVFIIIMLCVLISANIYVFFRLWHLAPAGFGRYFVLISAIILTLSFFIGLLASRALPVSLGSVLYKIGTSWIFIFLYLLIIFLLLDLIRITHILPIEKYMYSSWLGFGILGGFIAITMTLGFIKYHNKERVEITISNEKNTGNEKPLKIVAISDLHLGFSIGNKELEKWIELINKEEPDVLLIGGDIIDNSITPVEKNKMYETLRKIKTKYGTYAAMGNHEYISGIQNIAGFFQKADINLLRDSSVLINDMFYIIGRDDRTNSDRKSIEELTKNLDKSKFMILIDHQPYNLDEATKNNIDLQFSGHTHHGQLIPISWITNLIFEKSHGYLKKENTNIYVSSGIGIWGGKFRIGTQSEYVVFNINP